MVQQTVLERGAHGIGVLLSEEAPHGHQALGGAVLPTNLGLGATFDSQGVQEAEAAVAAELAASGIHIALVSGLDIARDPRWGRCEECFGEDPLMAPACARPSLPVCRVSIAARSAAGEWPWCSSIWRRKARLWVAATGSPPYWARTIFTRFICRRWPLACVPVPWALWLPTTISIPCLVVPTVVARGLSA